MSLDKAILKIRQEEMRDFAKILEDVFDFKSLGFTESYINFDPYHTTYVIYDSEWCRVKFYLEGGDLLHGYDMSVRYGRAHAPNEKSVITWNGEECWCWHEIPEALMFLDGFSPQEAVDENRIKGRWQYKQEEIIQKTNSHLELNARKHALVWEKYGRRLFDLFDLRHFDLWDQYVDFIVEYHKIKGSAFTYNNVPKPDKIC